MKDCVFKKYQTWNVNIELLCNYITQNLFTEACLFYLSSFSLAYYF